MTYKIVIEKNAIMHSIEFTVRKVPYKHQMNL